MTSSEEARAQPSPRGPSPGAAPGGTGGLGGGGGPDLPRPTPVTVLASDGSLAPLAPLPPGAGLSHGLGHGLGALGPPAACFDNVYESAAKILFLAVKWARSIPAFLQLSAADQSVLLEEGWPDLFVLSAAQWQLPVHHGRLVIRPARSSPSHGSQGSLLNLQQR